MRALVAAVSIVAAVTTPARAGCVADQTVLDNVAILVAATRVCPQFRSMSEDMAAQLFIESGAIFPDEAKSFRCRVDVGVAVRRREAEFGKRFSCEAIRESVRPMDGDLRKRNLLR